MIPKINSTGCCQNLTVCRQETQRTFTITTDTKDLDNDERGEEDGNPDTDVKIWAPVADGETGSSEFERQHGQP